MRQLTFVIILLFAGSRNPAQEKAIQRPPILGISHVRVHVTQPEVPLKFYQDLLGLPPIEGVCQNANLKCFGIGHEQFVQLDLVQQRRPSSLLEEIAFLTPDLETMRKFLASQRIHHDLVRTKEGRLTWVKVLDPEGNRVVFEEQQKTHLGAGDHQLSTHLIHAGFVVHDRAAEDHFYKDILGFRLYWHGGMRDDEDRWVAMQVPDGTDWIEYMLNVPSDASHHTLGVMNHISLGVEDIHAAEKQLIANGWKSGEAPKIGRDGKWQLNVCDPDDTRVEFMEFTPKEKPCCNPFTGPHPGPQPSSSPESRPKR
jgi:catechol 2,3-dioxygenase-like lactoylglutathione lyase family enzyme